MYTPRLTKPEKGNKYYIRKANGGYSKAIEGKCKSTGKPDPNCNTLANCVGYAYGRFHEIANDPTMHYLSPVNAEIFPEYTKCEKGQEPKLGSVIVWQKGKTLKGNDGAGHVAIVEQINNDGSILISQSGWNSKPFWTETITKGDGNWRAKWMATDYTFRCFIYNPAVEDESPVNNINVLYNGDIFIVRSIVKNGANYVRLVDMRDVLGMCDVSWSKETGVVITKIPKTKQYKGNGNLEVTLITPSYYKVNSIVYKGENYVRLRDFDDILDLCEVTYNSLKKMPEIKTR